MFRLILFHALTIFGGGFALSNSQYLAILGQLAFVLVLFAALFGSVANELISGGEILLSITLKVYALWAVYRALRELHREGTYLLATLTRKKRNH